MHWQPALSSSLVLHVQLNVHHWCIYNTLYGYHATLVNVYIGAGSEVLNNSESSCIQFAVPTTQDNSGLKMHTVIYIV